MSNGSEQFSTQGLKCSQAREKRCKFIFKFMHMNIHKCYYLKREIIKIFYFFIDLGDSKWFSQFFSWRDRALPGHHALHYKEGLTRMVQSSYFQSGKLHWLAYHQEAMNVFTRNYCLCKEVQKLQKEVNAVSME